MNAVFQRGWSGLSRRRDFREESKERSVEVVEEHVRQRRRDSSSTGVDDTFERSRSSLQRRERSEDSEEFEKSKSPIMTLVHLPQEIGNGRAKVVMDCSDLRMPTSLASAARQERRRNQSARESQKLQRQQEGKKPFYLTVDIEGRPYGPGRQAWITEINKLAAALDPSCTDIRKQAHGDICIFKDRLNERFEYSDEVNEKYLRGFMGKAITRRRSDLIEFINGNGIRPSFIDEDVWRRLDKLPCSKQRERKTEHGRYANACRRTLGRTSALGEEGVKQRLREVLRRSPDPEEVGEEMERDKGFGKYHAWTSTGRIDGRSYSVDKDVYGSDRNVQATGKRVRAMSSDEDDYRQGDRQGKRSSQTKEYLLQDHVQEKESIVDDGYACNGSATCIVGETSTEDDYIARLEAELRRMKMARENKASFGREVLNFPDGTALSNKDELQHNQKSIEEVVFRRSKAARTGRSNEINMAVFGFIDNSE